MSEEIEEPLAPAAALALAHSPPSIRLPLTTMLALDRRMARIVAGTSEAMLGQIRLAWWRETLHAAPGDRPQGDPVVDGVSAHWAGHEDALIALVDAWELMLGDSLEEAQIIPLGEGRGAPFAALAQMAGEVEEAAFADAGARWALADVAAHTSDPKERRLLLESARRITAQVTFPRPLRGLAILDALARRSLKRGGAPFMQGRSAAVTIMRAAVFGR
jgi:phytoene synthase